MGEDFPPGVAERGDVLVLNEGNFRRGNASVTAYDPEARAVTPDVFEPADGQALDVLQSATAVGDTALLLISNNTNALYLVRREGLTPLRQFEGLGSPRYAALDDRGRAVVTDLYDGRLLRVDLATGAAATLDAGGRGGASEVVVDGGRAYVARPEAAEILVVDLERWAVAERYDLGYRGTSLALLPDGRIAVAAGVLDPTDRGALLTFDPRSGAVDSVRTYAPREASLYPRIALGRGGVYVLQAGLERFALGADGRLRLSATDLLPAGPIYYALGVDPVSGEVYVGDARFYSGNGEVLRYAPSGELVDAFEAGPLPTGFVF